MLYETMISDDPISIIQCKLKTKKLTRCMISLQDPECFFRICNDFALPLNLKMPGSSFEFWRTREVLDVELWLGWHAWILRYIPKIRTLGAVDKMDKCSLICN